MHKSEKFTFVLLASSLVMLMIMPFLNQNNGFSNTVMAQEYDKYGDNIIVNTQKTIRNMSVEQVPLRASICR